VGITVEASQAQYDAFWEFAHYPLKPYPDTMQEA